MVMNATLNIQGARALVKEARETQVRAEQQAQSRKAEAKWAAKKAAMEVKAGVRKDLREESLKSDKKAAKAIMVCAEEALQERRAAIKASYQMESLLGQLEEAKSLSSRARRDWEEALGLQEELKGLSHAAEDWDAMCALVGVCGAQANAAQQELRTAMETSYQFLLTATTGERKALRSAKSKFFKARQVLKNYRAFEQPVVTAATFRPFEGLDKALERR